MSNEKRLASIVVTALPEDRVFGWGAEPDGAAVYIGPNILLTTPLEIGDRLEGWLTNNEGYRDAHLHSLVQRSPGQPDISPEGEMPDPEPDISPEGEVPDPEPDAPNDDARRVLYEELRQTRNSAALAANRADAVLIKMIADWGKPVGWHYSKMPS
jgi:hypothetical protein